MKNPVVHFEIQSQDPGALHTFYGEPFALFADPQGNCIGIAASQIPD